MDAPKTIDVMCSDLGLELHVVDVGCWGTQVRVYDPATKTNLAADLAAYEARCVLEGVKVGIVLSETGG